MRTSWFRRLVPAILSATVIATGTAVLAPTVATAAPNAAPNAAVPADQAVTPAWTGARTAPAAAGAPSGAPATTEVPALRTETSRTLIVPGSGYRTEVSSAPINYRDAAGAWKPIDTTLVRAGDSWHTTAAAYSAQLPATLGTTAITVAVNGRWVSLSPTGAAAVTGVAKGSRMTYPEIFPGVTLQYDALPTGLKESILLTRPGVRTSFGFAVRASAGLTATAKAGAVRIADAAGKTVFSLPAGYVTDTADQLTGRAAVTTTLAGQTPLTASAGAGVTLSVAPAWLAAAGRTWPVVLDPSVVIGPDKITDCHLVNGAYAAVNECSVDVFETGFGPSANGNVIRRALLNFDLSSIPQGAIVQDADLKLTRVASGAAPAVIPTQLLRVAQNWTTAATWNNSGTAAWNGGLWGPTQIDKRSIDNTAAEAHFYPAYLLGLWVNKVQPNQGLVLKSASETTVGVARFASSNNADAAARPTLSLAWTVQFGQRDTNTFLSRPLTDRCEAGANVGNGNLMVRCAELSVGGVGQPVTISRYYNSGNGPVFLNRADSPLGINRWQLSTGVYLVFRQNSMEFHDGSGAIYPYQMLGGTSYRQPPGLDATLEKDQPASGQYRIKFHKSGAQYVFEKLNSDFFNVMYQLTKIVDRNGNTTTFSYTTKAGYAEAALSTIKDTRGRTVTIGYTLDSGSGKDFLTSITDSTGRHADFIYTGWSLTKAIDMSGKATQYGYADFGTSTQQLSTFTDPLLHPTQFGYDTNGRIVDIDRHPAAGQTANDHFTYDDLDNPPSVSARDARANTTSYDVEHKDYASRVTKATDAKNNDRSRTFTSNAKVGSVTDAAGNTTTNTWGQNPADTADATSGESLTKTVGPGGATRLTEYKNGSGSACPTGAAASGSGYDAICSQDDAGNKSTYSYDGPGNASQQTSAIAATAKVDRAVSGSGVTPTDGRILKSTDPMNRVTTYNYTDVTFGTTTTKRLSSITPPSNSGIGTRTLTYDALDRLKTYTTGRTTVATRTYDGADRLTDVTYSDTTPAVHFVYDDDGNLTQRTDGSGTTKYAYDWMNRVTSKTLPSLKVLEYGYDLVGNLTSAKQDGVTTTYTYDTVNQVVSMGERSGRTTRFGYRADGKRTDTWYAANATDPPTTFAAHIHVDFDSSARMSRIKTTRASSNADANRVQDYSFCYRPRSVTGATCTSAPDPTNDRAKVQWVVNNIGGNALTYSYDGAGRLTQKADIGGGTTTTSTYDKNGNRESEAETSKATRQYEYNAGNQICWSGPTAGTSCVGAPTGSDTNYAYDPAGNQTVSPQLSAAVYNGTEQATSMTPRGGSAIAAGYAKDNQTERTTFGATTYVNGLLGVQSETTGGQTTYYERDPSGQLVSERTPSGDYYYVFGSANGTIGALVDPNGLQRASYAYTVWGEDRGAVGVNGTLPPNPYRFAGEYLDSATGYYKIGLRYYSPTQGRWTQQDSIESLGDPSNGNRYAYAGDDPVNNTDPTGAFSFGDALSWTSTGLSVLSFAATVTGVGAPVAPVLEGLAIGADIASTAYTCGSEGISSFECSGSALGTLAGTTLGGASKLAGSEGNTIGRNFFGGASVGTSVVSSVGWLTL